MSFMSIQNGMPHSRDGMLTKAMPFLRWIFPERSSASERMRSAFSAGADEGRTPGKETLQRKDKDALARILDCRRQIVGIDWDPGHYESGSAAESLEKSKKTKRKRELTFRRSATIRISQRS